MLSISNVVLCMCAMLLAMLFGRPAYSEHNSVTDSILPTGEERCFAQSFQPERKGQVTDLYIYRLLRPNLALETIGDTAEVLAELDKKQESRILSVAVKYNDNAGIFTQFPSCEDYNGRMQCGVDCDGGSFTAWEKDGKLGLDFADYGMAVRGGCGDEDAEKETRMLKDGDFPSPLDLTPHDVDVCLKVEEQAMLSLVREYRVTRGYYFPKGHECLATYPETIAVLRGGRVEFQSDGRTWAGAVSADGQLHIDNSGISPRPKQPLLVTGSLNFAFVSSGYCGEGWIIFDQEESGETPIVFEPPISAGADILIEEYYSKSETFGIVIVGEEGVGPNVAIPEDLSEAVETLRNINLKRHPDKILGIRYRLDNDLRLISEKFEKKREQLLKEQ